jgi:exopolysaccharide production protein ExoY
MLDTHSSTGALQRAADLGCIVGGYLVAGQIALRLSSEKLFMFPKSGPLELKYKALLLLALLSWAAVTSYCGTYHSHRTERLPFAAQALMRTLILWALMTVAGVFALKMPNVSRQFTAYLLIASGIFIASRQLATIVFVRRLRRFGYNWRTAVILGDHAAAEKFAQLLTTAYPMGYRVVVRPISGDVDSLNGAFPSSSQIDDVFIVGTGHATHNNVTGLEDIPRLLKQGKGVHVIPALLDTSLFRQSLSEVAGIPVISLMKGQLGSVQSAAKRVGDVVASAVLLIALSPAIAIIAILVKLASNGPVFFRQRRLGYRGKPFYLFKFRTMVGNAEQVLINSPALHAQYLANNFKLPKGKDPRVTRIGHFLRTMSLDELPQLFNVLRGDMSLVGPRPVVPAEVEKYGEAAGLFLSVKPGMTGHWQVSGRSELQAYEKRVELDLEYIRDQSLGKDFEILLRTVPAVLRGKGAH